MKKIPHWIRRTHLFRRDEYICSVCGAAFVRPYQACPACGVPMKMSKYDPSWVDEAELISVLMDDEG